MSDKGANVVAALSFSVAAAGVFYVGVISHQHGWMKVLIWSLALIPYGISFRRESK